MDFKGGGEMKEIKKTITKTFEVITAHKDMFVFNDDYRRIRGHMKYKGFECFNCNHKFNDNESFGLVFTKQGNKTVCNECANKLISDEAKNENQ
jgi:NAD-dependent SIR2 family protein deacetylase